VPKGNGRKKQVAIKDKITTNNVNKCLGRAQFVDIGILKLMRTSLLEC
jgi:hypothetical protein